MARLSRIVVVNVAHHVTQRGNARQFILAGDGERLVYLNLLRKYVQFHELSLLGYCLMSNHVHLVVVPRKSDALALAFAGLLPDVQPRASGGRPSEVRRLGAGFEADARTVRVVLERLPQVHWTCLARTVLFMPVGQLPSVGGFAIR